MMLLGIKLLVLASAVIYLTLKYGPKEPKKIPKIAFVLDRSKPKRFDEYA